MRAVVVRSPGEVSVTEVPDPIVDGSAALVAVEMVGICGTDLGIVAGKIPARLPVVMGHEVIGRVVRPGPAGLLAEGARVLVNPSTSCGHCHDCRADRDHLCANGGLLGRDVDGGFAQHLAVDEQQLLAIPDDLPAEAAALLQVLGTCIHAQDHVAVTPGSTAVVVGLGVSGLLMVQLLRARGVGRVIGVTRSAWKRKLAERLGATATATPQDAEAAVAELTGGRGAEVVVEAVGTIGTLAQSIELAGTGATVVLFGTIGRGATGELPLYDLYRKELTVANPRAARHRDYAAGIGLLADGRINLAPLRTHSFPLADAVTALDTAASPSALKVTLEVA